MTDIEYNRVLEEIYERFPSFQVVGDRAYKPGLDNMLELDKALGYPSRDFRSVHVAGTNGKGSVSHMIASALMCLPNENLQCASSVRSQANSGESIKYHRVGLFTSPHLIDFRERIKVDGKMVEKDWVYNFLTRNMEMFESVGASFFEITTAMAFSYFSYRKVDVAVIECGLGGRLDSTNIITPMASVITNIGFDHMQYLGNTLEEIAGEKAGIIKAGVPVITGETDEAATVSKSGKKSVERVFVDKASDCATDIYFAEKLNPYNLSPDGVFRSFSRHDIDNREEALKSVVSLATCLLGSVDMGNMDLKGDCQKKNIKTVCAALAVLIRKIADECQRDISESTVSEMVEAIESAAKITGLRGRWERLSDFPLVICDIGHNAHGMKVLMPQVERTYAQRLAEWEQASEVGNSEGAASKSQSFFGQKKQSSEPHKKPRLIMLFGVMKDKDLSSEVEYLPKDAYYLYINAATPRALPAADLKEQMSALGFKGEIPASEKDSVNQSEIQTGSIQTGLQWIKDNARPQDFVFIGGSSYVVAEVLANW